jgi:hypothetical protein
MLRIVKGKGIKIGGKIYIPIRGSAHSKSEADSWANAIRARGGTARVFHREKGLKCKIASKEGLGPQRWVPFRGWVVFQG